MIYRVLLTLLCLLPGLATSVFAYPEFEVFIEENSSRYVDCAFCHEHPEGPEGLKPGQMGSLTQEQMELLGRARAAFEPGVQIDNPLLNEFGDQMVAALGKREILLLRNHPRNLAERLGTSGDLDDDGIPDSQEYLSGTHPLDPLDGNPWELFRNNLSRKGFEVVMILLVTLLGLFGLNHLLAWFRWAVEESE